MAQKSIDLSINLIHFNSSKSTGSKILVSTRANKGFLRKNNTPTGNLEITSVALLIKMRNVRLDEETYQKLLKGKFRQPIL